MFIRATSTHPSWRLGPESTSRKPSQRKPLRSFMAFTLAAGFFFVLSLRSKAIRSEVCFKCRLIKRVKSVFKFVEEYDMLQLRPSCECCDKNLPPESTEARICSFECTFCEKCATNTLSGKCPNCGGELLARPRRPASKLAKFPASIDRIVKPHGCLEIEGVHH